jgi:hypothetical protein
LQLTQLITDDTGYLMALTGISDVAVRPSEQYLAGVPAILWPPRVIRGGVRGRERVRGNNRGDLKKMHMEKCCLNREDNNSCICSRLR